MEPERWRQVDRVFEAALQRTVGERAAFLDQECVGDGELRAEVESLLAAHGREDGFMEQPASSEAARLVVKGEAETLVGETVGPYKIRKSIGAGGMGEVYLAHDTRLNRPAALKLISAHSTSDEERVGRFRREALAASALNHPGIITIYEVGRWRGRDFIATEYVEGVTLRARMHGRGLSLDAALDIALQVAGTLAAAHAAGVVHRDVKPENVMVRPDGLVKVLDFGIAKYSGPARGREANESWVRTATGVVVGTTAYMSPEQARGQEVDARTDVWSLGVILYEMVGRRLPFSGKTPSDRVAAILEREPEPLGRLRRGVPTELERVVGRALAKDRDGRYARAADMAADLRKLRATLGEERPSRFALPATARGLPLPRRRGAVALAALLLAVTAAVAGLSYLRSGSGGAAIESIAVLPLANVGGADAEYLSDGITEGLINSLSQLPNLKVMSRSSVFRYKGQEVDIEALGNTLSVRAVLTGRVMQRGDGVTVSVELVDARDSSHLWGKQYNRQLTDLVGLQGEITRDVSRKLRARLSGADEQRLAKNYTDNSEAYQLYLRGRYHVLKLTRSEIQKGISYYRQAIDLDPNYALAYVGLAEAYRAFTLNGENPPTEFLPKAKAAAQRAIEFDDALAEAHSQLGSVIFFYDRDWKEAEKQLKRALELNPNGPDSHQFYANVLLVTGRHAEALAEAKRARELDPLNLRISAIEGQILIYAGRTDEALRGLQKTLELDPNYWFAHNFASSAYIDKGMYSEAVSEARKAREGSGVSTYPLAFLGYALAKAGRQAEARAVLEELLTLSKERHVHPYHIAIIYNGLGELDQTLAWLERGLEQHDPRIVFLKVEPKWNNLRDDRRFQDLVRRIGLPQ